MKRNRFIPKNIKVVFEPAPSSLIEQQTLAIARLTKAYMKDMKGGATGERETTANGLQDHFSTGREGEEGPA